MADWLPSDPPQWYQALSSAGEWFYDFLDDPEGFVKNIIENYLAKIVVSSGLTAFSYILWAVYTPFQVAADTFGIVADALGNAFGPAGGAVISTVQSVNSSIASAGASAGIAAPIIVSGLTIVELIVVLWLLEKAYQNAKPVILSFNPL